MHRRKFLKTGCTICIGSLAGISTLSLLESCATGKIIKREVKNESITVNSSDFEKDQSYIIIRTDQLTYDILLRKSSDTEYLALYMQCTHNDNPVYANSKEIFCPSHGSKFDFSGNVKVEPATLPLKHYKTEINNNLITIFLK